MTQTISRPPLEAPAGSDIRGIPVAGKLTILGLALYGVAMVLVVIATVIIGVGFMTVFFSVSLTITVALIGLVRRFGDWALGLTAVLMLLNLAANGRYMVEGLRYPDSFLDFTVSLFSVTGNVIAIGGAIVALVARRRCAMRSTPTRGERAAAGGLLAVLAALTVLSGVLTLAGRESVSAEAKAGALPVRMKATAFEPERLEVQGGLSVRILVRNSDPGKHSFTIDALGADVTVNPGSERLIELADVPPGEYAYHCTLFGHVIGTRVQVEGCQPRGESLRRAIPFGDGGASSILEGFSDGLVRGKGLAHGPGGREVRFAEGGADGGDGAVVGALYGRWEGGAEAIAQRYTGSVQPSRPLNLTLSKQRTGTNGQITGDRPGIPDFSKVRQACPAQGCGAGKIALRERHEPLRAQEAGDPATVVNFPVEDEALRRQRRRPLMLPGKPGRRPEAAEHKRDSLPVFDLPIDGEALLQQGDLGRFGVALAGHGLGRRGQRRGRPCPRSRDAGHGSLRSDRGPHRSRPGGE